MDRDALNSDTPGEISERQARDYLAWVNTAGRLLQPSAIPAISMLPICRAPIVIT
jgi:hypothetical protein